MEPILGQIVPVPIRRKHSWAGGARINLNEAITELNLPRLICIHPVNSIIYVNAAEVLELIRLPCERPVFESEREGRSKEREGWESKREIKIRDAIKHFAEIASGLIRGIISRINSWKGKGGGGNGEVGERGDDKLKYTVR